MKRFLKIALIAVAALFVLAYIGYQYAKAQTKKASPEETVTFALGDAQITINYSRPYKKGRTIFGGLVPYGEVWRTGANEATTFTVNRSLNFGGTVVPAGVYTVWSRPDADSWEIYLNSDSYSWGVDFDQKAQRDPAKDVAVFRSEVRHMPTPQEQFEISVNTAGDPAELTLTWDDVQVAVPITLP
ncbi:MAG: DUF2911 domain-containing protein [Flavobacteriales bacterium]|nr:DUF2911 domain-containing protein [Flavobacteriales bacterium]